MIKDEFRRALDNTFKALPDLPIAGDWHYGQVAFALRVNTNPRSPISGIIVYNVEKVKQTPKCVSVWAIEVVWRKGKGYLPNFPYRIRLEKHGNLKLISTKLN